MTEQELEEHLTTSGDLRGAQVLVAAFGLGVLGFAGTTLAFHFVPGLVPGNPGPFDPSVLGILSGVHAAMCAVLWPLALGLHRYGLRGAGRAASPAEFLSLVRGSLILRLAMIEGTALFGITICLIAILWGEARNRPLIWANLGSAIFLLLFIILTFPTRDGWLRLFRER